MDRFVNVVLDRDVGAHRNAAALRDVAAPIPRLAPMTRATFAGDRRESTRKAPHESCPMTWVDWLIVGFTVALASWSPRSRPGDAVQRLA